MTLSVPATEAERRARTVTTELWLHDHTRLHTFGNNGDGTKRNNNIITRTNTDLMVDHKGEKIFVPRNTEITIYRKFKDAAYGEILVMFQIDREQITLPKGQSIIRRSLYS